MLGDDFEIDLFDSGNVAIKTAVQNLYLTDVGNDDLVEVGTEIQEWIIDFYVDLNL